MTAMDADDNNDDNGDGDDDGLTMDANDVDDE